jgi:uncharacterized cupin superfamily protein
MSDPKQYLLNAQEIADLGEVRFGHPLNPQSDVGLKPLSDAVGLQRIAIRQGRIPPGKESFIYHSHQHEEEFLYILSGRGIAEIQDAEFEVGPGDFMGFPTPGVAHHLRNPFDEDLVYLMGGESRDVEIGEFPKINKLSLYNKQRQEAFIVDKDALEPFVPRILEEP